MGTRIRAILNEKPPLPGFCRWGGFLFYADGAFNPSPFCYAPISESASRLQNSPFRSSLEYSGSASSSMPRIARASEISDEVI